MNLQVVLEHEGPAPLKRWVGCVETRVGQTLPLKSLRYQDEDRIGLGCTGPGIRAWRVEGLLWWVSSQGYCMAIEAVLSAQRLVYVSVSWQNLTF